jgi:hypothetical protein
MAQANSLGTVLFDEGGGALEKRKRKGMGKVAYTVTVYNLQERMSFELETLASI